MAESLGTEAGPLARRQDGISALQLPATPAAVPSAELHLLIAPPRCLQQRTDYSDGREIEYGPLLAVTTQNNLSCAADCLHLASACKGACRWQRVQEQAGDSAHTEKGLKALWGQDLLKMPSVGLQKGRPQATSGGDTSGALFVAN